MGRQVIANKQNFIFCLTHLHFSKHHIPILLQENLQFTAHREKENGKNKRLLTWPGKICLFSGE